MRGHVNVHTVCMSLGKILSILKPVVTVYRKEQPHVFKGGGGGGGGGLYLMGSSFRHQDLRTCPLMSANLIVHRLQFSKDKILFLYFDENKTLQQ